MRVQVSVYSCFKFVDIHAHEEGNRLLFVDIINNTGLGMHSDLLRTTLGQVLLEKKAAQK